MPPRYVSIAADFHEICTVCISFYNALAVKIWMDFLKGLWRYGGFKRGWVLPNFQCPLVVKLCVGLLSRCKKALEVLYHHAKFGGARISPRGGKNVEFFVCPFVRHAFKHQSLCTRYHHEGAGEQKRF